MNRDYGTDGFLKTTVLSGIFLYPIDNAFVTVMSEEEEESDIVAAVYTNNGGTTGPVQLSAYDENYNVPQESIIPVKKYSIRVTKEGYSDAVVHGIPIFPGIVSEKFVYMIPTPMNPGAREYENYNTVYRSEGVSDKGGERP